MDKFRTNIIQNKKFILTEKIFTILALLLFTQGIVPLLRTGVSESIAEGDVILQLQWFFLYFISFLFVTFRLPEVKARLKKNRQFWLLAVLLGLALVSIFWSVEPSLSFRRVVALFGTSLFGIYLATRYKLNDILTLIAYSLGLSAVLGFLFAIVPPHLGIHPDYLHHGSWRGIYIHKNALGRLMVLSSLIWIIYFQVNKEQKKQALFFISLSTLLIFLSRSSTSLLVFILLLFFYWLSLFLRNNSKYIKATTIGIIITFILFFINRAFIFNLLGKDATLTGRTELWASVWEMIKQKLWFGYGFNGFWLGEKGPSAVINEQIGWSPFYSHNGVLEILLQLGLVGLVIFLVVFIKNIVSAMRLFISGESHILFVPLLYLAYELLGNITESDFLLQNSFFWILLVNFSIILGEKENEKEPLSAQNFLGGPTSD